MLRCYLSLNIERSLQNRLKLAQDDLKSELRRQKVKWENFDKFHLTLRFLGDTEEGKISNISKELGDIKLGFDDIRMSVSGTGFFPNEKYPNVVFIGLEETGNSSGILVDSIDKILGKFGYKPDHNFVPHITMGRFRRENRVKIDKPVNIKTEPMEINFSSFFLMKSTLKPGGSVYEVIKEFKFR
jgi:RNA 2',3'-cyclic 3'-phosphodiesterase